MKIKTSKSNKSLSAKRVKFNRRMALHPDVVYLWFEIAKAHLELHYEDVERYFSSAVAKDKMDREVCTFFTHAVFFSFSDL